MYARTEKLCSCREHKWDHIPSVRYSIHVDMTWIAYTLKKKGVTRNLKSSASLHRTILGPVKCKSFRGFDSKPF
jgi:hypothetical protein